MRSQRLVLGLVAYFAIFLFSGIASAKCSAFPEVSWWGNLSHERVVSYVNSKHGGDWYGYIDKWERQLDKLSRVYKNGSSAVIRSRGVKLNGPALAAYIGKVKRRISVNRCLAQQFMNSTDIEMAVSSGPSD